MTYKTHREFSIWFALVLNIILYERGLINTNYYLSMMVILLFSKQGALFPDVDHHWDNVKEKTMLNKVVNFIIHKTGGKHRSWQTHSFDIWACSLLAFIYLANRLNFEDRAVALLIISGFYGGWFSHLFSDMLSRDGVRLFFWLKKFKLRLVPNRANLVLNLTVSFSVGFISLIYCYLSFRFNFCNLIIGLIGFVISILLVATSFKLGNMKFVTGLSNSKYKNDNGKGTWEDMVYQFTLKVNFIVFIVSVIYPYIKIVV